MSKAYAIMPMSDYRAICDTLQEKTGTEGVRIKSGEIPDLIADISESALTNYVDVSDDWQAYNIVIFTLNGVEYDAPQGQTWLEWCTEHPEYGYTCEGEYESVYGLGGPDDFVCWYDLENDSEGGALGYLVIENEVYYSLSPLPSHDIITFSIDGFGKYQAVNGITWYDWCQSQFNTDGFSCSTEYDEVLTPNGDGIGDSEDITMYGYHHIVSDASYIIYDYA